MKHQSKNDKTAVKLLAVSFLFHFNIGVPRILQWRGFTWRGPDQGVWGTEVPQWGSGAKPR